MSIIVCDTSERQCMIHRCEKCPGKDALIEFLKEMLPEEGSICYQQWQCTDISTLVAHTSDTAELISLLATSIDDLTTHSFIAKCQSQNLKNSKCYLRDDACIAIMDFSENYRYVIQDEIQSFHWNNQQCTVDPVVIYCRSTNRTLEHMSLCSLSDDIDHDT